MKKIFLFVWMGLCAIAGVQAQEQHDGLPGVPQTEAYVVTPVDTISGVTVRKVSFLRSNQIVLVAICFYQRTSMVRSAIRLFSVFILREV